MDRELFFDSNNKKGGKDSLDIPRSAWQSTAQHRESVCILRQCAQRLDRDGWMNRWAFSLPVDKSYVENKSGGAVGTALHDTTRRDAMRCDTQDESRFLSCRHGPVVYSSSSRPVVIVRLGNSDATAAADVPQPTAT